MANATPSNSTFPILSPVTYLNYLTPQDVRVYEVSRNIFLAVVGAALMEWLESIPADIKVIKMGVNSTVIAYLLSRPAAILFGLLAIIAKSPNSVNCQSLMIGEFVCCFVAMTTSSFLFLQRVRAVWKENKFISAIFSIIWLTGVAFDALLFDVTRGGPLADTDYCIVASLKGPWGAGAPIVSLAFDTLVFFCISYKVATAYQVNGKPLERISWSTILSGKALPRIAKSVLRGGQQFYLIAVIANVFLVVFMSFPLTSLELAVAPTPVAIIIISVAACRVFRNLRMQGLILTEIQETDASIRFGVPDHLHSRYTTGTLRSNAISSTYYHPSTAAPAESISTHTLQSGGHEPAMVTFEVMEPDPEQKV